MDDARADFYIYVWWRTADTRRPRSDLPELRQFTYVIVNYLASAIPELPDQVWSYDRDPRELAPPPCVRVPLTPPSANSFCDDYGAISAWLGTPIDPAWESFGETLPSVPGEPGSSALVEQLERPARSDEPV